MILLDCIIPIYKCNYVFLNRLLDSLLSQDKQMLKKICFLFIENGVKTDCEKILAEKLYDINYKYFYIATKGVSNARNFGIRNCNADYITFVDYDDVLMMRWSNVLIENLGHDIVLFNYQILDDHNNIIKYAKLNKIKNRNDLLAAIFKPKSTSGYVWNKVFKKEIIIKHDIKFNNELLLCEDLVFSSLYAQYCNDICVYPNPLYLYFQNTSSASYVASFEDRFLWLKYYDCLDKMLNIKYKNFLYAKFLSQYYNYLYIELKDKVSKNELNDKYYDIYLKCKKLLKISSLKMLLLKSSLLSFMFFKFRYFIRKIKRCFYS